MGSDHLPDHTLLVAGDPDAWAAVERGCGPLLARHLLRSGARRDEIPDLLQDTWISAYSKIRELREPAAFQSWLREIATNSLRSRQRECRPRIAEGALDSVVAPCSPAEVRSADLGALPPALARHLPELQWTAAESAVLDAVLEGVRCHSPPERVSPDARAALKRKLALRNFVGVLAGCGDDAIPLTSHVMKLGAHLRGGPLQVIHAAAPRLREDRVAQSLIRPGVRRLLSECSERIHTYARGDHGGPAVGPLRVSYASMKTAVLLSPDVMLDYHATAMHEFRSLLSGNALLGRFMSRMNALTGDLDAVAAQNQYWRYCLRKATSTDRFFGAAYCTMYFAPPNLGAAMLAALDAHDERTLRSLMQTHRQVLRRSLILEAAENLDEDWYAKNQLWAETNFLRLALALHELGTLREAHPFLARALRRVALHALVLTREGWIQRLARSTIAMN